MANNKMREEFEVWSANHDYLGGCAAQMLDDRYKDIDLQHAWESLVIELPSENPIGSGPGDCEGGLPSFEQHCAAECNFILRDCREAIEAAGLKVKP